MKSAYLVVQGYANICKTAWIAILNLGRCIIVMHSDLWKFGSPCATCISDSVVNPILRSSLRTNLWHQLQVDPHCNFIKLVNLACKEAEHLMKKPSLYKPYGKSQNEYWIIGCACYIWSVSAGNAVCLDSCTLLHTIRVLLQILVFLYRYPAIRIHNISGRYSGSGE